MHSLVFPALVTAVAGLGLNADAARVHGVEHPVPVSAVTHIGGFVGERIALNREVYLKQFPIDEYVDFVVLRQHRDWIWTRAEQHGKWIDSAFLSAIESGDTTLLAKARKTLDRILDSQEESGYLGATARDFRTPQRPIRGMDPYELYFVFHVLATVAEETGDRRALDSAERLADYFLRYFGEDRLEFWPSALHSPENVHKVLAGTSDFAGHSVHYGWEGTLLCDPIARLYQLTGKKKYLDWSRWVVSNIDRWSGWNAFSRLDSVADGTLHVDQLQPYVHAHTFHMNFMGFLRLYQITGDKSLLRKVEGAWDDISRRQMYITGGVSVAEHYEHDYVKPLTGNIIETCATMSWMQLTEHLLCLTGDTKYADAMERLLLNHVFAAQDALTGTCRYHTAPNGTKPDGYFHGPDCCTASGHRIISLLPTFFYARSGHDFFVNQYIASTCKDANFGFRLVGNYPYEDSLAIEITKNKGTERLHLRMPSWCAHPEVSVNGRRVENAVSGTYLVLNRKWQAGDRITVRFPMQVQWVRREHHSDYPSYTLEGGEIMYREAPASHVPYALLRGPVVYCIDMVHNPALHNDDVDLARDVRLDVTTPPRCLQPQSGQMIAPAYETEANYMGRRVTLVMTPFAGIGQWWREGEQQPGCHARAFSYAIWNYVD